MKENILTSRLKLTNKKATDKVLSVYWFAILFIVAAAIVYMAVIFYGKPYDARETEANLLIDKIADCIAQGGKLNENWNDLSDENIIQSCKLNFNVEDFKGWKNNQYYIEINYRAFDETAFKAKAGNSELNNNCKLEGKYMPTCVERSFYVLDSDKNENKEGETANQYIIKIKSVVGKAEKNVQ